MGFIMYLTKVKLNDQGTLELEPVVLIIFLVGKSKLHNFQWGNDAHWAGQLDDLVNMIGY